MILVDPSVGSRELLPIIQRIGRDCQLAFPPLPYGDFVFDGNGPRGPITIGIERKSLHDILHCIDDARYADDQRGGMHNLFGLRFLMMEGMWKPHEPDGWLMEGWNGGASWGLCKYRSRTTLYSKLFNYLLSVSLSQVIVVHSRDMYQTAYNVCMMYDYFQKPWHEHTSMFEIHQMPLMNVGGRPSLVKRWAAQIDGIGVKLATEAEHLFHSPIALALGKDAEWASIKGISIQTAQRIVREIWNRT